MKITIISVGNKMPDWVQQGCDDYLKRFNHPHQVVLKELKSERRHLNQNISTVLSLEETKIRAAIPIHSLTVVLDEQGKNITSMDFSELFTKWDSENLNPCFIIGSADGISPQLKNESHQMLRLSAMTFPHALAKMILLEQIYRAFSILSGHPYHRI